MNKAILIGRLTSDPKISQANTANGTMTIARYTLAVDRRSKTQEGQNADFISCVAFGKAGEFAEKYLTKGMKIAIEGHIQTGSYTNKDGQKVYTTDVIVDSSEFVERKGDGQAKTEKTDSDGFMAIPDNVGDEGLPFN